MATITIYPMSMMLALTAPFWIPAIFAAYALGSKKVSLQFLFLALTIEAVALGVCWQSGMIRYLRP